MSERRAATIVPRSRLHERLDDETGRVVVITAPRGFGKTTLLHDWAGVRSEEGDSVAWVALAEPLSSELDFWRAAVRSAGRSGLVADPDSVLDRLAAGHDPVGLLREQLSGQTGRLILVVDDFEHAACAAERIEDALTRAVSVQPQLRVVVATRTPSALSSDRARLSHGHHVIETDELAFTLAETADLLAALGEELTGAQVRAVHESTGGYPLALRAFLLGDHRINVSGDHPGAWHAPVTDTLLEAVPSDVRAFMTATAVPPYFDLSLAADLTERPDADAFVADIEGRGLGRWMHFGPTRPVFQYAGAVRAVLARAAEAEDPGRYREWCGRAAAWLQDLGEYDAALRLALAGEHYALASNVTGMLMTTNPQSYTTDMMTRLLAAVRPAEMNTYPLLAFAYGAGLMANPATRPASLDYFRIAAESPADAPGITLVRQKLFLKVVSLRVLGRYDESAALARRWADRIDQIDDDGGRYVIEGRATLLRHFAYSLLQGGDPTAARTASSRALSRAQQPWSANYTLSVAVGIHAIDGRRDEAEALAAQIDPAAWPPGQHLTAVNALGRIGRSMMLLDEFKYDTALAEYDGCTFVDVTDFWPFVQVSRLLAELGRGGATAEARRIAEQLAEHPHPPGVGDNLGTAALHAALGVAWLAAGRQAQAAEALRHPTPYPAQLAPTVLLTRLLADDNAAAVASLPELDRLAGHTTRSRALIATLGAAAALRSGNSTLAVELLERATTYFRLYGARAHLALVPASDLAALRVLAVDHSGVSDFLTAPVEGIRYDPVVALSERELEVLTALLHGTREEVAASLFVSVNTVKSHLKSAYRKLGVSTREQAIGRALELGLLDCGDDVAGAGD